MFRANQKDQNKKEKAEVKKSQHCGKRKLKDSIAPLFSNKKWCYEEVAEDTLCASFLLPAPCKQVITTVNMASYDGLSQEKLVREHVM